MALKDIAITKSLSFDCEDIGQSLTYELDGRYGYVAAVGNDCCWPLIVQPKVPLFDAGMNFRAFVLHQSLLLYHVHTTYLYERTEANEKPSSFTYPRSD